MKAAPALEFNLRLEDSLWRRATSAGFHQSQRSSFDNVLGAVDSIAVRQEQPLTTDVPGVADSYSRKGSYSFNVKAICTGNYEFSRMSCRSSGSVHDSTAFGVTTLGRMLMDPHHAVTARLIEEG